MKFALCDTGIGWVALGIEDGKICRAALRQTRQDAQHAIVGWGADEPASDAEAAPLVDLAVRAASGEPVELDGMLRITGGTAFQRDVWQAVAAIPFGETASYAEVAMRVGKPRAARAVGHAVGHNPIPLLIPCHRVVGSNGIGGYGGGRLALKRKMLRQEGVTL
ncbi:MAG: methylated-DNA--[protein]-cysteine S-methyltransferase [Dehalococcoidia bacterium]